MSPEAYELLKYLAGGEFYSGEVLGERLGVSRACVWKYVRQLRVVGVDVLSVKGRGYCLEGNVELLDESYIKQALGHALLSRFSYVSCHAHLESTNSELLSWLAEPQNNTGLGLCLAEYQSGGRGRRGRQWQSPFASGLCLSMVWRFAGGLSSLQGLSLAVGLAVCESLERLGLADIELKWPNDLLADEKKLGGILVEVGGEASGDCFAVIGIGLNGCLSASALSTIDQPAIDLRSLGWAGERNKLAVEVIASMVKMLERFSIDGFECFRESWCRRAAFMGQSVMLSQGDSQLTGQMRGVSELGEICLESGGALVKYAGGELSLRRSI